MSQISGPVTGPFISPIVMKDSLGNEKVVIDVNGNIYSNFQYFTTYFVDGNAGLDTNDGLSWNTAYKTLAVAFAASHAKIAASSQGWAGRNAIYIKGDSFVETLVKGAQKTDVIGVGSCDHLPMARIIGNHVLDSTSYMGMRFINVAFKSPAAGGVIITIPTQQSGISFIGCLFDGGSTTPATKAILSTASELLTIKDCRFVGKYSTATIDVGAGASNGLLIQGNDIESGAIGVAVDAGATCALRQGKIINNVFNVTTLVVDENSDLFVIGENRGRTAAAQTLALIFDYNVAFSYNNIITSATVTSVYPAFGAIA